MLATAAKDIEKASKAKYWRKDHAWRGWAEEGERQRHDARSWRYIKSLGGLACAESKACFVRIWLGQQVVQRIPKQVFSENNKAKGYRARASAVQHADTTPRV